MKDKHIFSEQYNKRKEAVIAALRREEKIGVRKPSGYTLRMPLKFLICAVLLSALAVGVYASAQLIEFRMEKNGGEVRIRASLEAARIRERLEAARIRERLDELQNEYELHANGSLNKTGNSTVTTEKPLRSWNAEEGEISIRLNIPDLPADMWEIENTNGKYDSNDTSRSMTINGIDLRRSDLDQIIGGAAEAKELSAGGKAMYIITSSSEAAYYNRTAYILFEKEELVLKLWVSYGITDDELIALASTLTIEETDDAALALPIINEVSSASDNEEKVYYVEMAPIYESDLLEIGESVRGASDYYTMAVNSVEVYDSISVLNPIYILRKDYVNRFTDDKGNLIPYNRTEIVYTFDDDGKFVSMEFGESVSTSKKLYVITLTMSDITMDMIDEKDRDGMLRACVNGFSLHSYTVTDGKIEMLSPNAIVDRKPEAHAQSSEIIYREYIGNNQWKVAYLIDEDVANGNLILDSYTGKIYVKIK